MTSKMALKLLSFICLLLLHHMTLADDMTIYDVRTLTPIPAENNTSNANNFYTEGKPASNFTNCTDFHMETNFTLLQNGSLYLYRTKSLVNTYYLNDSFAYICNSYDVKPTSNAGEAYYSLSENFLSCSHVLIDPEEYKLLDNGTVFIEIYSKMYEPAEYLIQKHGIYVCLPKYDDMMRSVIGGDGLYEDKFADSFAYVTYVGISLSIASLLSHLVVFFTTSSVRNLPGWCLASLSLSLLSAYSCFLGAEFAKTVDICASVGVCIYYFFLAAFFWMNAIAFDVWRSFRVVTRELRISSNRVSLKRLLAYSVYSWVTPAILVIAVKMADSHELLPLDLKPSFGAPICWFGQRKPLLLFFATPLFLVMLVNAAFFLDVTYVISKAALKTGQSLQEATLRKRFSMFLKLALIMGLTWIVGIIAGSVDNQVLWYLFIVLNTLQGLFIFVVFSLSSKVKNLFCKSFMRRTQSGFSTSVRTISQAV